MSSGDSRINSLFERFGSSPSPDQTARWQAMGGKVPYQAVELAPGTASTATMRVYFSNGNVAVIKYSTISAVLYTAVNQEVSVVTRSGAFVLKGSNLLGLLDEFERERAKVVRFFDESTHEPPQEGSALITRIDWFTAKQAQELAGQR